MPIIAVKIKGLDLHTCKSFNIAIRNQCIILKKLKVLWTKLHAIGTDYTFNSSAWLGLYSSIDYLGFSISLSIFWFWPTI